jgi:O-antigen ligase
MDNHKINGTGGSRLFQERPDVILVWLLFLLLFPLFYVEKTDVFGFEGLSMFSPTKVIRLIWFFFTTAAFVAACFHCFTNQHLKKLKLNGVDYLIFAYIFGAGISIIVNTPTSIVAWYRFAELSITLSASILVLRIFILMYNDSWAALLINKVIFRLMYVACAVLFVIGLYDINLIFYNEVQGRFRFGGYVYAPNYLPLLFSISLLAAFYLFSKKEISLVVLLVSLVVTHLGVILAGSRTGIAILLFIDVISNFKFKLITNKKAAFLFRHFLINLACLTGLYLAYKVLFGSSLWFKLIEVVGKGEDPLAELLSLNNRISVYITALNGIFEQPLFGVGYVEGVRAYFANNYPIQFWVPPHAHNSVLEVILAQGVFGGIAVLVFIGLCCVKSAKILLLNKGWSLEQTTFALIFTVLLISSLTSVPFGSVTSSLGTVFFLSGLFIISAERRNG